MKMITENKAGRWAGILYLTGTVSGILSVVVTGPVRSAGNVLSGVAGNESAMVVGSLFVLLMGISLAVIPCIVYPVLKKYHATAARGYIVFRSGLETVAYTAMAVSWLLLLPVSKISGEGASGSAGFAALGSILFEAKQIFSVCTIVFIIGAVLFYSVLHRWRLIPRWLTWWGLVATVPYLTAGILGMFGVIDTAMNSTSSLHTLMVLPLGVQEMVLAVWLIVKGFTLPVMTNPESCSPGISPAGGFES